MTDRKLSRLDLAIAALSGVFVFLLVFKLPLTPILNESDHHMFLYEGMRLLDGDVMYRDFFQFTFPGSQAWYWLTFSIFGLRYWILPATIVLLAASSALVCLAVSKATIPGKIYVIPALLFIFFGFRWDGLDGTHRMFSPIFLMLASLAIIRGSTPRHLVLAGLFCALASFFTQQRGFIAIVAIASFLLIEHFQSKRAWPDLLAKIGFLGGSYLVVLCALTAYFALSAGVANFIFATLEYPAKYYRYATYNNFGILAEDLQAVLRVASFSDALAASESLFYLFVLPPTYLVFWLSLIRRRKEIEWASIRAATMLALLGTALTLTTTAPNTSRLFQIAMPGLVVFVWLACGAGAHSKKFAWARPFLVTGTVISIVLGFVQAIRLQMTPLTYLQTPSGLVAYPASRIIDERYRFLIANTKPGDMLFEAYQPYIYFPLHLRNPTKYGQIWPSDYTRPEHVTECIADLKATRPQYILWNNDLSKPAELRADGDHTGPLAEYLKQNYRPASGVIEIPEGRIQIWERVDQDDFNK